MKPAPFQYVRATSVEEAVAALQDPEAKALAGGQSLVPLMNLRLARPRRLVDLNRIPGLDRIEIGEDRVWLGALVRHEAVARSRELAQALPLLPLAAGHIGHRAIRARGTVGGSLAHADPAAEWPAVAVALDATIHTVGPDGERSLPARQFFVTLFTTALAAGELVTAVSFPRPEGARYAFREWSRRPGDFALVAVAARRVGERVDLAFAGVGDTPRPVSLRSPDAEALAGIVADFDCPSDLHASGALRRRLALALGQEVLAELAREVAQ